MERSESNDRSEAAELILPRTNRDTINNENNGNHPNSFHSSSQIPRWPTVDGSLGLSEEESIAYARRFFKFGFFLLPFLWAVNCFYFWPVLRHSRSFPLLRRYVVGSAIGFLVFAAILSSWALTFSIGGERLFGHTWDDLVMYNVAERYGLTVGGDKKRTVELKSKLKSRDNGKSELHSLKLLLVISSWLKNSTRQ
ncbi:hypothetical protein Vadar_014384 [Vaccinium darrowii]|uniref:Uncharacterized protein n=1 Tax=Vaccinium darrowii TaxID=229202 RepID=A0ACB7Z415_9ERIC|nr:hypothetical protein Vadar_014384 [Vaccinium darrowii]